MIDLRSDTLTKPNAKMRRAMAEAEVGDDVYREDPTITKLQNRAAEIFGREAALYIPSGTMGNLIAIHVHTKPGQEIICERKSHIYNYEMSSMAAVAGVMPRVVDGPEAQGRNLSWELIEPSVWPRVDNRSQTALICLENTHNMAGGSVYRTEQVRAICEKAHERHLPVHLDGARIFNAAVALGENVADMTRSFDSVTFCVSKGLGAPVGSLLLGTKDFFEEARRVRKMLGGGMRQAGVLAAAGLVALEDSPARLHEDHEHARMLADCLAELPGIKIDPTSVVTNIVIFELLNMEALNFLGPLASAGILCSPIDKTHVRMVTHCDVSRSDIETTIEVLQKNFARKPSSATAAHV